MPATDLSIVDEVETALDTGSAEKRLETVKRVTDLFLLSAGSYKDEQIELFDTVLERLIKTIEIRALADVSARIALAELSAQLAPVSQAPPSTVRRLANNDEITIARPVLMESARLGPEDLVEVAATKGEQHLLAIAGRWWLKEVVTDALLARHYPSVSRRLVNNPGARVSSTGFAIVVTQAESDPELAIETGIRVDLPPELRHRLLRNATQAVRARLLSRAPPDIFEEIRTAIGAVTAGVNRQMSQGSRLHRGQAVGGAAEAPTANSMKRPCWLSPNSANMKRRSQHLAQLSRSTIDVIRPLMQSLRDDGVLVACKAAELSWETVSAILESRFSTGSLAPHELAKAKGEFAKITVENARRLLKFWQVRAL